MSVYSQISANKWRTWLVMALFMAFVATVVFVLGRDYLWLALIFSGLTAIGSYYWSDKMVMAVSNAKEVTESEQNVLLHVVTNMAMVAGIPKPKVYLIDDSSPNAFATGRDPKHASIAVTTGLLAKLDKTELEGVVAHEMSHIKDYDTRLMAVVAILVGLVALLADWFMRSLWWGGNDNEDRKDGAIFMLVGIVLAILSPIIATLIQLAISRRREFLADASAAYLTRYPEGLARALEKISTDRRPAGFANNATAHLFICNPFKNKQAKSWFAGLFDTHPPVEERIKILREM